MVFPYGGRNVYIHISASSHTRVHKITYVNGYLNRLRLKKVLSPKLCSDISHAGHKNEGQIVSFCFPPSVLVSKA